MRTDLCEKLKIRPGLTAVIGSGGKTGLIDRLWRELPGSVIVCTSTHIFPPAELPLFTEPLDRLPAEKLCIGTLGPEGKLTAPPQDFASLKKLADYVLVEADGARQMPLKAHLAHEPVIPSCADRILCVVGLTGLEKPILQAAHRPDRYAKLCGRSRSDLVTPQMAAQVLRRENLADFYVLNQADDHSLRDLGSQLGEALEKPWMLTSLR